MPDEKKVEVVDYQENVPGKIEGPCSKGCGREAEITMEVAAETAPGVKEKREVGYCGPCFEPIGNELLRIIQESYGVVGEFDDD